MQFRSASSKQHSTTPAARYNLSRLELAVCTRGFFFFNDTATTEIYTLSLHDALRSQRVMEIAAMRDDYADPRHHARLMTTLRDRKSTRLNSSHITISYAVFCLKKKNIKHSQISINKKQKKQNNK